MKLVVDEFQAWFGLPIVQDAIDGTHIVKPSTYPKDYYYHKFGGYSVVAQAIINCKKTIIDVSVGLLGSVNDSKVLHNSTPYKMDNIMVYLHLTIQPLNMVFHLIFLVTKVIHSSHGL
jgi:hypothetical protein